MPCQACPYRRDVASGIWAHHEYEKLREYDQPMLMQPIQAFACHATPEHLCHGWAVVHSAQHHGHVLALRLILGAVEVPEAGIPLFESGAEAAAHGQRDIDEPGEEAEEAMKRLLRKHPRLLEGLLEREEMRSD
jgi:hypothetical protein